MNYQIIYDNIIYKANNRIIDEYTETHHIIPKCMGGKNTDINLVKLTPKEHFICHKLLCEIYPSNPKLKDDVRLKISEKLKGHTISEETKRKISETLKAKTLQKI
jgi:hypothetical protein